MKRPEVEEFKRLTSVPASAWGMADSDVVELCDYILYLEAQHIKLDRSEVRNATLDEVARFVDRDQCFTRACTYFARKIILLKTPT